MTSQILILTNFLIEIADITTFNNGLITGIIFEDNVGTINIHILYPLESKDEVQINIGHMYTVFRPLMDQGIKVKDIGCNKYQVICDMIHEIVDNKFSIVMWDTKTKYCTKLDTLRIFI